MSQYTREQLAEILELHAKWRASCGANGSMANLYGADLSRASLYGANLSRASLYGADLYGAEHILRGPCLDGYEVFLVRFADGPRYQAGCRWFTVAQAKEHWNAKHHEGGEKHCTLMLTGLAGLLEVAHLLGWEGCAP